MLNERIGPTTARFAVLGASLPHTWSPYIHNSLFDAAKIDAIYVPITVSSERLASAVDVFRSCFAGFNITIPYKERLFHIWMKSTALFQLVVQSTQWKFAMAA